MARNRKRTSFDDLADHVERRSNGPVSREAGPVPKPAYIPLLPLDDSAVTSGHASGISERRMAALYQAEINKHMADSEGGVTPGLSEFISSAEPGRKRREDGNSPH